MEAVIVGTNNRLFVPIVGKNYLINIFCSFTYVTSATTETFISKQHSWSRLLICIQVESRIIHRISRYITNTSSATKLYIINCWRRIKSSDVCSSTAHQKQRQDALFLGKHIRDENVIASTQSTCRPQKNGIRGQVSVDPNQTGLF